MSVRLRLITPTAEFLQKKYVQCCEIYTRQLPFFEVIDKRSVFWYSVCYWKTLCIDVSSTSILRNRVRNITWNFVDVSLGQVCWNQGIILRASLLIFGNFTLRLQCNMLLGSQTVKTHTITDKLQAKLPNLCNYNPNLCNYNIAVPRLNDPYNVIWQKMK